MIVQTSNNTSGIRQHEQPGTVSAFARNVAIIRALGDQRGVLESCYAPWRVDRTYASAIRRLRGIDSLIINEHGDEILDGPSPSDRTVELAALAVQALCAADQPSRLEALDVLTVEVGPEAAEDWLFSDVAQMQPAGEAANGWAYSAVGYLGMLASPPIARLQ
jgi:hypothetical protein